jgi:hypothetical protein
MDIKAITARAEADARGAIMDTKDSMSKSEPKQLLVARACPSRTEVA